MADSVIDHVDGGGAIFSLTPMTEEAARKWAEAQRQRPWKPTFEDDEETC